MFGIAWGVGSLLLLVGLGEGFRSGNKKQFDSLGENVMFIWSGRAPAVEGSFTSMRRYFLTYKDYEDIKAEAPSVKEAAAVISRGDIRAVSDYFTSAGQLMGVPANFNTIRFLPIDEGRWLNENDVQQKRAVVILGDEGKKLLFPGRPAVGNTILMGGIRFEVIGSLKRIGHGDNSTLNLRMFVPFTTMKRWTSATKQITDFDISPDGKRAAFAARGDIFTVPAKDGSTRNLTRTTGIREQKVSCALNDVCGVAVPSWFDDARIWPLGRNAGASLPRTSAKSTLFCRARLASAERRTHGF